MLKWLRNGALLSYFTTTAHLQSKSQSRVFIQPHGPYRISFCTDVEGNLQYFNRFIDHSDVLGWDKNGDLTFLGENDYFVFGGDLFDKGEADLRLGRHLLQFKKSFPDRVFLIIGNRDSNKLRFTAELSDEDISRLDETPCIPVVQNYKTPKQWLEEKYPDQDILHVNTRTNRLKWMLECTLGCSRTFEYRRNELKALLNIPNISDEMVTQSFLDSVKPDGVVYKYLRNGNLAVAIGNTLFVHGNVNELSYGFVPDAREFRYFDRDTGGKVLSSPEEVPGREYEDLKTWLEALDDFVHDSLDLYDENPFWFTHVDGTVRRGGESLMASQSTPASQGRNVCVSSPFRSAKFQTMSAELANKLKSQGIERIIVGHKPVGDAPLIANGAIEVIMGDTSFSDVSSDDNRGICAHDIMVQNGRCQVKGRLADGTEVKIWTDEASVGLHENGVHWVKAKRTSDNFWLATKYERRKFINEFFQTLTGIKTEL